MRISVIVDNVVPDGSWVKEHGLALWIEFPSGILLFDTGAGNALLPNLEHLGLSTDRIRWVVLSHGHNDHTGGVEQILKLLPNVDVYYGEGMGAVRYSLHEDRPVKELTIPTGAAECLKRHPMELSHVVKSFSRITSDFFLTGGIPRRSFEQTGGPFYFVWSRNKRGHPSVQKSGGVSRLSGKSLR